MTNDPKRNQTRVAGMASDTYDHCTTATSRQFLELFEYYIVPPLALLKANRIKANRGAIQANWSAIQANRSAF